MTTVLSQKGQIIIPIPVCEQLRLVPGDDFEIAIEDDETITLRRIMTPANKGLVDLLLECPTPFKIPPRDGDDKEPTVPCEPALLDEGVPALRQRLTDALPTI